LPITTTILFSGSFACDFIDTERNFECHIKHSTPQKGLKKLNTNLFGEKRNSQDYLMKKEIHSSSQLLAYLIENIYGSQF
jgi:hypothetical protein